MPEQLSLWDAPAPDTYEFPFSWADDDQSLPQLERLAGLLKQHGHTARDDSGTLCRFRVDSTRIADGKVYGTCILLPSLNTVMSNPQDDEDDC